jgi:hypothetical protein
MLTAGAFRGGREERFGQLVGFLQAFSERDSADRAMGFVVLPAGAGKIAAHDTLDGKHLGALDQHGAALELACVRTQDGRIARDIGGDEVVGHYIAKQLKPEERELRENFAFAGNASGEHVIEGGNAVRGDEQKRFVDGIEVAHLAAREQRNIAEIGLRECLQGSLLP